MAITTPEHIQIYNVTLESARVSKPIVLAGSNTTASVVAEINIFENITLPYLTGNIVLQDDNDLYSYLNILGSEKITVSYGLDDVATPPMTKKFYISRVRKTHKSNDNTTVLVMDLIEDVGYYNYLKKFSKSYEGSGEQIIQTIVTDQIDKPIEVGLLKESYQAPFRYIVPFQTPFDAIQSVLAKITTTNGLPFFFHASLGWDGFVFSDLESILQVGSFNKGQPLRLSQAATTSQSISEYALAMHNFTNITPLEDTLKMAQMGAIGSDLHVINAHTGESIRSRVNTTRVYNNLINNGVISREQAVELVDLFFQPDPNEQDGMVIADYTSRVFTAVQSVPYPQSGLNGYSQESYQYDNVLKVIKKGVSAHLQKNLYTFTLPGLVFSGNNLRSSVGNLIDIEIPSSSIPDQGTSASAAIDKKRSGQFLIMAKRHTINVMDKKQVVSVEVGRVTNLEQSV